MLAEGTPWRTLYHVIEADAGTDTGGPTLLVIAGVHGDEPAGARAAEQIRHWTLVRGRLIVVPRANAPGLQAGKRGLPGEAEGLCDLNRNFPRDSLSDEPRGEAARAIWRFVRQRKPDWVLDLHEGKAFRVSHEPAAGERRSVGSSVIYFKDPALDPIARRVRDAANATEADPERLFGLIDRGPFSGGLVSACVRHLGMRGMILET
ncbi:MAG: M99 family carboxypeptidase catalytic domain-containing protein, partial [Planctomycetota bacterium]